MVLLACFACICLFVSPARQVALTENLAKYAIKRKDLNNLSATPFARGGSGVVYRARYHNQEVLPFSRSHPLLHRSMQREGNERGFSGRGSRVEG